MNLEGADGILCHKGGCRQTRILVSTGQSPVQPASRISIYYCCSHQAEARWATMIPCRYCCRSRLVDAIKASGFSRGRMQLPRYLLRGRAPGRESGSSTLTLAGQLEAVSSSISLPQESFAAKSSDVKNFNFGERQIVKVITVPNWSSFGVFLQSSRSSA